jgi:pilus assembly protein CpaF
MSSVFKDAISNFLLPVKDLLDDPNVSEVMINGPFEIFVEKKGLVYRTPNKFNDDEALLSAMRAIAQSVGRIIDADNPRLDARLPDGSRIHVVLPPMAKMGPPLPFENFPKKI